MCVCVLCMRLCLQRCVGVCYCLRKVDIHMRGRHLYLAPHLENDEDTLENATIAFYIGPWMVLTFSRKK